MDETTRFHLSPELDAEVRATLDEWAAGDKVMRLRARGRRALRVHLGSDVKAGLGQLRRAVEA